MYRRRLALAKSLDLTAMVDVVFQLLLFFMLSSSFVTQAAVPVDLPESSHLKASTAGIEITITADDELRLGGASISLEDLRSRLTDLSREGGGVSILGDRGASLGRTIEVWDACRSAGVPVAGIRARWKEGGE
ncbi:MAG: biopolymer transporter ExbD [Planctomycetes bacterium]|nr:biopolymer transporter ExbD [Planctomycetota bacterium]